VADAADGATPFLMRVNITSVVLFLAIFGGVGLLLSPALQLAAWLASAIAVLCGLAGSAAMNRVLGAIVSRERPLEPVNFTGTLAQVTIPIREGGGTGEIVYTLDSARCCSGARSDDGRSIAKGAEVVIVRYDKGIAYVAPFDDLSPNIITH
jgi:membrane protein implicated in regulation of membrane protease activity